MHLRQILFTASLFAPLTLAAPASSAGEEHEHQHRRHGAHVHGIAALNLALEGQEVQMELDSPAVNIVGFEHAPGSEADHAALDQAIAALKQGDRLFRFNDGAGCRMDSANVTSALLDDGHENHEHEGHTDIQAAYHFQCDEPGKLTQLTVELFEIFPGMQKLEVQYIIEDRQGAAELTADGHAIKF